MSELTLSQAFINSHPGDAARLLERLADKDVTALLEAVPPSIAARALAAIVPTIGSQCLARLAPDTAAAALVELPAASAAVLLRRLDPPGRSAILAAMPEDETRLLGTMLDYPRDCAGSLMDARVFAAIETLRVGDALAALRRHPAQLSDDVFVVDDGHRLLGVVRLRDLMPARRHEPVSNVMNRAVTHVSAAAPRAAILNHPGWRRFHTLPVVDDAHVLVGAITHARAYAIFEEDVLGRPSRPDAVTTVVALGELYWLGLSGVLDGVASAVRGFAPATAAAGEADRGQQ